MAIVQISRIQIRRGKAYNGTGFPQLASGEMAWAIDTQSLYIGNGSVAEGAPSVGNTKILTDKDLSGAGGILGLLEYSYKSDIPGLFTGPTATTPVRRTVNNRLDDQVSLQNFITPSDVQRNDYSDALQRAIYQLFARNNPDELSPEWRVILNIGPGIFPISAPIIIPSFVTLKGSGKHNTIIEYTHTPRTVPGTSITGSTTIRMVSAAVNMIHATITGPGILSNTTITGITPGISVTISSPATITSTTSEYTIGYTLAPLTCVNDSLGVLPTTSSNQPRNVHLSDFSIYSNHLTKPILQLNSVINSTFTALHINGGWVGELNANHRGIDLQNTSSVIACSNNYFDNIDISQCCYGICSSSTIYDCTFTNGVLYNLRQGIVVTANYSTFSNITFKGIYYHGMLLSAGTGNVMSDFSLINVGNLSNSTIVENYATVHYPQLFISVPNNVVRNVRSAREALLSSMDHYTFPYIPVVAGNGISFASGGCDSIALTTQALFVPIVRLPVCTDSEGEPRRSIAYSVNYVYKNRQGILRIMVNLDESMAGVRIPVMAISDTYMNCGDNGKAAALSFSIALLDRNGIEYTVNSQETAKPYSIQLSYKNLTSNDSGTLHYSYVGTT